MSKQYLLSIAGMFDSQEETKEENNETFHNEAKLQKEKRMENAEAFHNEEKLRKERK